MKLITGRLTSLKTRFMKAMLLMLLPLVLIGASGFFALIKISDSFNQVVDKATKEVYAISHIQIAVARAAMPPSDYDRAMDLLARVLSLAEGEMKEDLKMAQGVKRAYLFFACMFGFGMVLAIKSGMVLFRSVRLPLKQLEEGARRFGKGDLGYRLPLAIADELGQVVQTFNVMAEMLEKNQTELKALAVRDGLTGLFNHREFYRRLEEEIERVRRYRHPCSLLMLDIDHFKKINDTYGHQAGDRVLRILANWVRSEVRPTDQVSRYGGEEFAIILPETPKTEALKAAERIRKGVSQCLIAVAGGEKLNATLSVGVAAFPDDAESAEELVAHADRALYAAKDAGRNRVYHS